MKGEDPFSDSFAVEPDGRVDKQNPFDDEWKVQDLEPEAEQPYHVFSRREKWFVIITIGVAGMFSGLSSNIYFPSLDAIARVREHRPRPLPMSHTAKT